MLTDKIETYIQPEDFEEQGGATPMELEDDDDEQGGATPMELEDDDDDTPRPRQKRKHVVMEDTGSESEDLPVEGGVVFRTPRVLSKDPIPFRAFSNFNDDSDDEIDVARASEPESDLGRRVGGVLDDRSKQGSKQRQPELRTMIDLAKMPPKSGHKTKGEVSKAFRKEVEARRALVEKDDRKVR